MPSSSEIEFADNPDPRCPVVVVLDCSDSMSQDVGGGRTPLEELSGALDILVSEVYHDPLSRRRIELSFVPYGTQVSEPTPFSTVENITVPQLSTMGITNTGAALTAAVDAVDARKEEYKHNGIAYYQPIILLISDGLSMDDLSTVSERIKDAQSHKRLSFFPVGVGDGADLDQMSQIGLRPALKLDGVKFTELFQWLSASAASVSASNPGDKVAVPSPAGWAEL